MRVLAVVTKREPCTGVSTVDKYHRNLSCEQVHFFYGNSIHSELDQASSPSTCSTRT